jgi:fructosamine-3-kinase
LTRPALSDVAAAAVESTLGAEIVETRPVGGGSICVGWEAELSDATRVFVKTHADPPPRFFTTEVMGLDWLRDGLDDADAKGIEIPHVLAVGPSFLVVEWVEGGNHTPAGEADLGRGLAALHRSGAPRFGWDRDGYIGTLPQLNRSPDDSVSRNVTWAEFYGEQRLAPLARLATDTGSLPDGGRRDIDQVINRLDQLTGPPEGPARLHGDLWGGNALTGLDGRRWLIDPAPYGGSREIDLAMMHLFGGFGPEVFAAYDESAPPLDGIDARDGRRELHQLYPLLVHTVLFGGSYGARTAEIARRYA